MLGNSGRRCSKGALFTDSVSELNGQRMYKGGGIEVERAREIKDTCHALNTIFKLEKIKLWNDRHTLSSA
jgi:hypothetical protein